MKTSIIARAAALAALTLSAPGKAEENIARGEMPNYCRLEAASAFGVSRGDVMTLPAEPDKGMFTVYGQTPAEGQDALFFTCTFNGEGQFVGVDKSSDKRKQTQAHGHSGGVAVKDMARHCAGEAAAQFGQRPKNISTQPAIEDQGMYSVFGQYPPSGADPTVFICTYGADGKLVGVDKQ